MAASNTPTKKFQLGNTGILVEEGTFTSSGGTTTHTITADESDPGDYPGAELGQIKNIVFADFTSNGGTAIAPETDGLAANARKITFTANDAGTYRLFGNKFA